MLLKKAVECHGLTEKAGNVAILTQQTSSNLICLPCYSYVETNNGQQKEKTFLYLEEVEVCNTDGSTEKKSKFLYKHFVAICSVSWVTNSMCLK